MHTSQKRPADMVPINNRLGNTFCFKEIETNEVIYGNTFFKP